MSVATLAARERAWGPFPQSSGVHMEPGSAETQDNRLWILIESGSNQDFIFQSTRRRFQVGASALLTDLPSWVDSEIKGLGKVFEVIVSTSSKALVLTSDREEGRKLVKAVTTKALEEAPGLDVWGYVEPDGVASGDVMGKARIDKLHAEHAKLRWTRPTSRRRFPLQPFLETCSITGLPAVDLDKEPGANDRARPVSAPAVKVLHRAARQVDALRGTYGTAVLEDLTQDVENAGWVAVVHADGNAVGKLITEIRTTDGLRTFSKELEEATAAAFKDAVDGVTTRDGWLIPLILGGDDVTFICDGRVALNVTRSFLMAFERCTGEKSEIQKLAERALGRGYLTAAAGIAFVKPHFPFHTAYELAEELAGEAKRAKELAPDRSSYDFHVLHDSVARPLADLREHLVHKQPSDEADLWPGPFLVGSHDVGWEAAHSESFLLDGIAELGRPSDEQLLSGTGAHDLRAALLAGQAEVKRTRVRLTARSRKPEELRAFLDRQSGSDGKVAFNRLIAALDAADMAAGVSEEARGKRSQQPAVAGEPDA